MKDAELAAALFKPEGMIEPLLRGIAASAARDDAWLALFGVGEDTPPEAVEELRRRLDAIRAEPVPEPPPPAERLAALRAKLDELGVDGFVLPRTDRHGSEYLPGHEERLAWLTGFSGSAGAAVILRERAAVFADGRYTVQVRQEVDAGLYDIVHAVEKPPGKWLEEALPEGTKLGVDPQLHARSSLKALRQACAKRGAELVTLDVNPVDAVWTDRPPPPVGPVRRQPLEFAGESSADKRRRVAAEAAEAGATHALIAQVDAVMWLLNVRGSDVPFNPLAMSFAIVDQDGGARWYVDPVKLPPGLDLGEGVRVQFYKDFEEALDQLGRDGAKVLADPARVHAAFLGRLKRAGATVVEAVDPVLKAKARKNEAERDGMRNCHRRDGAALVRFLAWLEREGVGTGQDEVTISDKLEGFRAGDALFQGPSFPTIAGHGPHGAIVHYRPTPAAARTIQPGTLLLLDSGAQYLDGTTDVTRTVALGDVGAFCTNEPEAKRRFTLVLKGMVALTRQVFPKGTTGAQVDAIARVALWQAGLDYDHGTGHGIGAHLCVHEGPANISKRGTVALEPGMILSNEPGYYKQDAYGIRIENLVLVQEAEVEGAEKPMLGFETLTLAPIDRRLVLPELLSPEELAWLDAYHARVSTELTPLLADQADRDWLAKACAPLGPPAS